MFSILELPISFTASLLILIGQFIYIKDILSGRITPSILSWIGWGILMATSTIAQIINLGWKWSLLGIVFSTIGCIVIATAAFIKQNYSHLKYDKYYLLIGLGCIAMYVITKDPWLTTFYAVLADLIIGIPTILKTLNNAESEKTHGWTLSVISWSLTLTISFYHDLLYAIFPIYLFGYSLFTFYLIRFRN